MIDEFKGYHIAEFNIAHLEKNLDHPQNIDFVNNLDPVNSEGEKTPGFVWMLKDDEGVGATGIEAYDDPKIIINFTIWTSISALYNFTYSGKHVDVFKRRKEWFEGSVHYKDSYVLWWIKEGEIPSIHEAKERLDHLSEHGPSSYAFTFRERYPPKT